MALYEQLARSARLYQRGLISAQEFTNVTLGDLRDQDDLCECGDRRGDHRDDMCFADYRLGMKQTVCACDGFRRDLS